MRSNANIHIKENHLSSNPLYAVVPAAGIGKRMGSEVPKQYLSIEHRPIIHYSLETLVNHPQIERVIVVLSPNDQWFGQLSIAKHPKVSVVIGGAERADSVLCGLDALPGNGRVLVHDAARPCLTLSDLDKLIQRQQEGVGAILASKVRDTMKRATHEQLIDHTVEREHLFHALTPQLFDLSLLKQVLVAALSEGACITDEASAMEWANHPVLLVPGRFDNIKVTHPEDLQLATVFLAAQQRITGEST